MTIPFNSTVFVLTEPGDEREPRLASPVFVEFDGPLSQGVVGAKKARLRSVWSFQVGEEPAWEMPEAILPCLDGPAFLPVAAPLAEAIDEAVQMGRSDLALCALVREMSDQEDAWDTFRDELEDGRFTANAWFERDRRNLTLTDGLTSRDVVCLWDDDVDSAIEDGYIRPPRVPRPNDSDWLEPLLEYAREMGAIDGLLTRHVVSRSREAQRA